ncbi:hypothetical protein PoB_002749400 [Plakobranchus ocellatus]|uniref:Uncharacterized protein n=1 Tax=Plakobranchus ocellatus TaxID=259542 RepID=A0AAV4A474_9GAST|nr:hypothetical protein PoB_002749400 [Plakobranchus ocellatus]
MKLQFKLDHTMLDLHSVHYYHDHHAGFNCVSLTVQRKQKALGTLSLPDRLNNPFVTFTANVRIKRWRNESLGPTTTVQWVIGFRLWDQTQITGWFMLDRRTRRRRQTCPSVETRNQERRDSHSF